MNIKIKSPLLRLFVLFYSFSGFQLFPVKWTLCSSVANFLLNTLIIMGIAYKFIFEDPFLYLLQIKDFTKMPFLHLLIEFNATLNYPITYFLMLTYYLIYMPSILKMLDSVLFLQSFTVSFTKKPKSTAIFVIFCYKFFYLLSYYDIIAEYYQKTSLFTFVFSWATLYLHFLIVTLPLALSHYIQLCTRQAIKSISELNCTNMRYICQEVKKVAELNSRLHRYNSGPLLLFLLSNTIDELSIICRLSVFKIRISPPTFFGGVFVYKLYLAYLSHQTVKFLREIVKRYKLNVTSNNLFYSNVFVTTFANPSHHTQSDLEYLLTFERQLSLNIYYFINFNFTFVFGLALFLLQYSVFLLQTKQGN